MKPSTFTEPLESCQVILASYREQLSKVIKSKLCEIYPGKYIYIILDGWAAHTSNAMRTYADLQPRLNLVYLPRCSSYMNPVEIERV